jgi:hypothetical protein
MQDQLQLGNRRPAFKTGRLRQMQGGTARSNCRPGPGSWRYGLHLPALRGKTLAHAPASQTGLKLVDFGDLGGRVAYARCLNRAADTEGHREIRRREIGRMRALRNRKGARRLGSSKRPRSQVVSGRPAPPLRAAHPCALNDGNSIQAEV